MSTYDKIEHTATKSGLLGYHAIIDEYTARNIIIYPFDVTKVKSSSYDVHLADCYFEEQPSNCTSLDSTGSIPIYNLYSETEVRRVWGNPKRAMTCNELSISLEGVQPDEKIILLRPGHTVLAHTMEFIGGRSNITTMMKARSSFGRNFIEVCKCAGWGDVGYYNRWTMEITNNSRNYTIPLVVGRPIAQLIFFYVSGSSSSSEGSTTNYTSTQHGNKYQSSDILPPEFPNYSTEIVKKLESLWNPENMLPKLYKEKNKV